jgi:hypothetical protein
LLDLFDHVYVEQTPYLIEQKAAYAEYVATFEDASPEPSEGLREALPASAGQAEPASWGGVH